MSKIIGIDLGTTNSCVAVLEGGEPKVIPNSEGNRTTPSVVAFKKGEELVGETAKRQAVINVENTISSIKRKMGTKAKVEANDKKYTPEEISAKILAKLKADAESYLGEKVTKAVITVPAYFNDAERQATKNAGKIAGLEVERIINEPTAAALAYGLDKQDNLHTILVYDLGGGTFDVSILEVGEGVFEVKATSGNTHLGGEDFDHRLVDFLKKVFEVNNKVAIPTTATKSLRKLKETAEIVKNRLSQMQTVQIEIDSLYEGIDFKTQITRTVFEGLCSDLFNDCLDPVRRVLEDAKLTKKEIDEIVLVGGATRIPKIQEILTNFFDGKQLNKSVNPD